MAKQQDTRQPDSQDHQNPSDSQDFNPNSRVHDRSRRCDCSNYRQQPYRFSKYRRCNIARHTLEVFRKRIRDEEDAKIEKNNINAAQTVTTQKKEVVDNREELPQR